MAKKIIQIKAKELTENDRALWEAMKATGKFSLTTNELLNIAKQIDMPINSLYRSINRLRGNSKIGVGHVYNVHSNRQR